MVLESSAVSSPLCNNDTVKLVLAYLGRGAGLFAFANKSWKAAYAELTPAVRTSYSAVLTSPACIKWAHALGFRNVWSRKRTRERLQQLAGSCADLPTLQAAAELGLRFTPTAIHNAVRSCSLSKVIWLHEEQHCELSEGLLAAAAEAGSVDIMQWLVEKHVALNPHTTAVAAAKSGAVQVFEWLQQRGVSLTIFAMQTAASNGHLPLIQWLRSSAECPSDSAVAARAAESGHVETVRFLHENGCPWNNELVCEYAVRAANSVPVLQCLLELGSLSDAAVLQRALLYACAHNNLAAAQWLREHGALVA
jgi:hypothetical protein